MIFALQVSLILLIVSGAIAYIGNYVGRYIGKRRLVLFGLRPRHTAIMIAVVSGSLIAAVTLTSLLFISQDARTAFLGLEQLKSQVSQRSAELRSANDALQKMNVELAAKLKKADELEARLAGAKTEIGQLNKTKLKLSREVAVTRLGEVIFKKDEIITLSLIQAGPEKEKIEAGLKAIIAAADADLRSSGIRSALPLIEVPDEEFERTVYELAGRDRVFVVKLVAARNSLWGEEVPAYFELAENKLIYREGQEILSEEIPGKLSAPEVEQAIMLQLGLARQAALEAGVLADPSGSLGGVPYSQIADLAKKVKGNKTTLKIFARKDIFAIGPLDIGFKAGK
jgi:uncharacterized protein (DUF3084 family)